jgi:competence protein ComEC
MGLLIGQRANLPDSVKQDLLMVGLTHIIAVSGYNLTIILQASRELLAGYSKRLSTMLTFSLIAVFLLLTGASASIVRAAIVSTLSIVAGYYGRNFRALNLLALAAAITAWAKPFYVWSDLSWYLSFLAFFGVMVVSPLIQARWPGRWHQTIAGSVALESVCAELMSLPFVLFIFGQMSLVGLPANVLVTALVPLAMLLGTVAGLGAMLFIPLAGWLAWPATYLLNYMLDIAHVMAHLPHIFIKNRALPLTGMLFLYGLIILFLTVLWHKTKTPNTAIITDRDEWSQQMVND